MLVGFATAQPASERVWTGVNGKSFSGVFHRLDPDQKKADFLTKDGKLVTVALENLVPQDRELILNPAKFLQPEAAPDSGGGFKPTASPDRRLVPELDPKVFGAGTDEPLVDAVWIALLWWDQTGVLDVPARGSLKNKAEWLHKKLTRGFVNGGGNVNLEDARMGIDKFFADDLKELAGCRATVNQQDYTPTRLAGYLKGANAVVLHMSMSYSNGRDYSVATVLESMTEEGKFVFHVFGRRFSGVLQPIEGAKAGRDGVVPSEYVLDRRQDLPDYYAQNGARFFMGQALWNGALVLQPYVYLTPGKPSPLPDEEKPPVAAVIPATPEEKPEPKVKFPVGFIAAVEARREWSLTDGTKILASPVAPKGQKPSLRSVSGAPVFVDASRLSEEDRARLCFWEANRGRPLSMPKLDLTYRLNTSMSGNFEVKVSADDSLGRVVFTDPESTTVLVYDMNDGAFVSTYIHRSKTKETTRIHQGRFLPENLLPRRISSRLNQADVDLFLSGTLPLAPELISAVVPCRRVRFPASRGPSFLKPDIDFVLCQQTTVTAGLFQLLFNMTAGGMESRVCVFSPVQVPSNPAGESVLATLAACRVLPLRIAWENPVDPNQKEEYHRVRNAGKFSIGLTRAAVPTGFPEGHFAIPAAARAMTAGDTLTTETSKAL